MSVQVRVCADMRTFCKRIELESISSPFDHSQVDATIMGKDMGTPKLRNGVVCLGKLAGYDSDDETEWHGFD